MIIRRATEEAAMLGHRRVGTEHLLLAVISAHDDPTTCALRAAGVTQDTARGTLRRLLVSWNDDGCPKPRVSVA
jgi:ATP-dependent Clp protease ATP-binding subunit ClpA